MARIALVLGAAHVWSAAAAAQPIHVSGSFGTEIRGFLRGPQGESQHPNAASTFGQLRVRARLGRGHFVTIEPFVRMVSDRPEHTVAYFRELTWTPELASATVEVGAQRIQWGRARLAGPIDVLNQKDRSYHPFSDARIGQPALRLSTGAPVGSLELVALSRVLPRLHVGRNSRLRGARWVDPSVIEYADGAGGPIARGEVVGFPRASERGAHGVSRHAPRSVVREYRRERGVSRSQRYESLRQLGVDASVSKAGWSMHVEAATRRGGREPAHFVTVFGVEQVHRTPSASVTATLEHHRDSRGDRSVSPAQDDLYLEGSVAFHDSSVDRVFARLLVDRSGTGAIWTVGLDHTLAAGWSMRVETWQFNGRDVRRLNDDGYMSFRLLRAF